MLRTSRGPREVAPVYTYANAPCVLAWRRRAVARDARPLLDGALTRRQIEDRVTELAAELEGAALVDAVRRFADGLSTEERDMLGEVLLERGREQGAEQYAEMTERMRAARWRVILPPARERPEPPA